MGIELFWDNEDQTVLLAEFRDRWTWDELHAVLRTIKRMSVERNQIFGAIVDVSTGLHLPGGTIFNREGLRNFQEMLKLGSDGKGPVVIYGVSDTVRQVFEAVKRIERRVTNDVYFADSMDDARRVIYAAVANMDDTQSSTAG